MKKIVNEAQLSRIILESIKRRLNEIESFSLTFEEFCDMWAQYKMPIDLSNKEEYRDAKQLYEYLFEEWNNWPEDEKEEQSFREYAEVFVYERAKEFYTDPDNDFEDNDFMEDMGWMD